MNAWHCTASLSGMCRTWTSSRHMTVIRMWLNLRPQNITQKYTRVQHRDCESGLAKACCTRASPAHPAGHVEMAWTDESHLFWYVQLVAPIVVARRDLIPVTGTVYMHKCNEVTLVWSSLRLVPTMHVQCPAWTFDHLCCHKMASCQQLCRTVVPLFPFWSQKGWMGIDTTMKVMLFCV